MPGVVKFIETVEWWLPGGGGRTDEELVFNGCGVSIREGEKVLQMDGGDGCTPM